MNSNRLTAESQLNEIQRQALYELRGRLTTELDFVARLVLFGSVARGTAEEGSDIDLLVLTTRALDNRTRHKITDIEFDVNLKYDTNFSTLVVDTEAWERGIISVLPIRAAVQRDGILV